MIAALTMVVNRARAPQAFGRCRINHVGIPGAHECAAPGECLGREDAFEDRRRLAVKGEPARIALARGTPRLAGELPDQRLGIGPRPSLAFDPAFGLAVAHWLPPFVAIGHLWFFWGDAKRKTFAVRGPAG